MLECVGGNFAEDARGWEVVGAQSERGAALAHGAAVQVGRGRGSAMVLVHSQKMSCQFS